MLGRRQAAKVVPDYRARSNRNRKKRKLENKHVSSLAQKSPIEKVANEDKWIRRVRMKNRVEADDRLIESSMWQATNDGNFSPYSVSDDREKSKIEEVANVENWITTLRMNTQLFLSNIEADDRLIESSWQATNGENFSTYSVSGDRENLLASTQNWRNLSINESQDAPLVASEQIFIENVNGLMNLIGECVRNPAQWSRERTNSCFYNIQSFVDGWKRQLMMEKEKIDLEVLSLKGKLENKHDLLTNQLNILNSVLDKSITFMNFSQHQKDKMQSLVTELNYVRGIFGESARLVLSEPSLAAEFTNKEYELNEARKQVAEYHEELKKTQDSLKEANLKLENKNYELNEAKKQTDEYHKELKKTQDSLKVARKQVAEYHKELRERQDSLKEAHLKVKDLMYTNSQLTQVDQQVMLNTCLQDKEKQLNELKKQLDCGVKKQRETDSELIEIREQLKSFVANGTEGTLNKRSHLIKMMSDIQTSLLMKNPTYRPSCQVENENLNEEEKIFNGIKAIIEYEIKSAKSDNKQDITESALGSNSSSTPLRVSEYEVHLVTFISIFLKILPFPVTSKYIHCCVANIDKVVDLQFVENLLKKFPSFFKEEAVAPGSAEKNWTYIDLKPDNTPI